MEKGVVFLLDYTFFISKFVCELKKRKSWNEELVNEMVAARQ